MPIFPITFIADNGCFEMDLRYTCIILGAGLIFLLGVEAVLSPRVVQRPEAFADWAACFACNVLLIAGAGMRNKWVVAIWLLSPLVVFIIAPVAGIVLQFSELPHNHDDRYLLFCEYMLHLCVYFISGRYVISYIIELRNFEKVTKHLQRTVGPLALARKTKKQNQENKEFSAT